jgi:hypothetical protein
MGGSSALVRLAAPFPLQTFHGVDICGERLAEEIRGVVAQHPGLERISLLGHSMGGLIARYAAGERAQHAQRERRPGCGRWQVVWEAGGKAAQSKQGVWAGRVCAGCRAQGGSSFPTRAPPCIHGYQPHRAALTWRVCAAGRLFDPESRTICGLKPCHFVSMATPHLGCDGELNPAQVSIGCRVPPLHLQPCPQQQYPFCWALSDLLPAAGAAPQPPPTLVGPRMHPHPHVGRVRLCGPLCFCLSLYVTQGSCLSLCAPWARAFLCVSPAAPAFPIVPPRASAFLSVPPRCRCSAGRARCRPSAAPCSG